MKKFDPPINPANFCTCPWNHASWKWTAGWLKSAWAGQWAESVGYPGPKSLALDFINADAIHKEKIGASGTVWY